jgi:uncharacterized protein (DUF488 family)
MKKKLIYTLGTSTRSLREFFLLLRFYQISQVVDVRRFPQSKNFPHFNKKNLEKFFKKKKIKYFHLEKLGGYQKGGYLAYTKTREFKKALLYLIDLAKNKRTALFCAERFPWRCHRRFIAQALKKKSFKVLHILEKGKVWTN